MKKSLVRWVCKWLAEPRLQSYVVQSWEHVLKVLPENDDVDKNCGPPPVVVLGPPPARHVQEEEEDDDGPREVLHGEDGEEDISEDEGEVDEMGDDFADQMASEIAKQG